MAYATKTPAITHESIINDVRAGDVRPVYYLMGEESYYIDRLSDFLADTLLTEEEKGFNLITLFAADTDIDTVISTAKGYPMGAQRQVVIVKEAQTLKDIDRLEYYLKQPQPSTVLVFCHKNGALDRRKKLPGLITKANGVVYESKKLYDSQLPTFVVNYLKQKGNVSILPPAAAMMAEHVGADLSRMASELDKLCIALPDGERTITPELVAAHIGISKDYNIFELQDALGQKDIAKVMKIAYYFSKNPKANPIQRTLPSLFRYFSNLMLAYYAPEKTEHGLAEWLGMGEWQVRKNILPAMRSYSGIKTMHILSAIRRTDARSKGVENPNTPNEELLRELLYFILH